MPSKTWRECIRKIWEVDPLECPKCGGEMIEYAVYRAHVALWRRKRVYFFQDIGPVFNSNIFSDYRGLSQLAVGHIIFLGNIEIILLLNWNGNLQSDSSREGSLRWQDSLIHDSLLFSVINSNQSLLKLSTCGCSFHPLVLLKVFYPDCNLDRASAVWKYRYVGGHDFKRW
jgi:hypothetical protein